MTIYLLEGKPGAGKSYHAMKDILVPSLKNKRKVFHNLPVNVGNLEGSKFYPGALHNLLFTINKEEILTLDKENVDQRNKYSEALIIIDEAHEYFYTGEKISEEGLRNFFTFHRHWNLDIVLLTQDKSNLHRVITSVINVRFYFRNFNFIGMSGRYQVKQYEGMDTKIVISKKVSSYDKEYFTYYESVVGGKVTKFKLNAPTSINLYGMVVMCFGILFFAIYIFSQNTFTQAMLGNTDKAVQQVHNDFVQTNNVKKIDDELNENLLTKKVKLGVSNNKLPNNTQVNIIDTDIFHVPVENVYSSRMVPGSSKYGVFQSVGAIGYGTNKRIMLSDDFGNKLSVKTNQNINLGESVRIY